MIDIARWEPAHRPVHLLFQMTLALAPVLKLDFKHIALVEGHVVDEGQFPPPVRRRRMLENVIINIGHELTIAQFVQFAYSHITTGNLGFQLMAILTYGKLGVNNGVK